MVLAVHNFFYIIDSPRQLYNQLSTCTLLNKSYSLLDGIKA